MIQYAGRTTTVTDPPTTADPQGRITTKINLVTGSLARTQDHTGYYIGFKYDAFGSVLSVTDSLSNTLNTMTYDYGLQAFQRTSNDADLGARSSTYDALGELTAYSDAKGQNFSFLYDALSRPTTRTEPDLTTTWTWGNSASSFNVGKLQSGTAASSVGTYSEAYAYDSKTRPSSKTITIPGDTSYTYTSTYNLTTGLLDTLQYPVSTSGNPLKLQYAYQNGILQQISDVATGTHYWTANTINPRGQYTQETLGNNVVVNRALDAVTGWVSSIQAGVGGGAALQNNSYLFDEMGNLTQRQDNNLGLTENVFPDSLYRLDHTVGDTNTQMTYDAMGRIATWAAYGNSTNVNDYATPQSGCTYYVNSQLHAVRKSTQGSWPPESFCRDANGNLTTMKSTVSVDLSVAWTSFNQPSDITGGTSSSQFFYNADHQRYKQIASYSGALETTYYVGGLLEKMINSSGTAYRHYIPAGNNTVVYTRLSTGTNSTYYLTKDHLGSTAVITDSNGAPLVKEKFSALGWNENTAAEEGTMASVTRHEFTGHEGLDNVGLVNMNGRIYVPSGSMFLSPDPTIPEPGNTQSYNRYSYVSNNPLSYTDPTGFAQNISRDGDGLWDFASFGQEHGCSGNCSGGGTGSGSGGSGAGGGGSTSPTNNALGLNFFSPQSAVASLNSGATNFQYDFGILSEDGWNNLAQSPGGATVWNDPNDATAGLTAYGSYYKSSDSGADAASTFMTLSGVGAAGTEARWGELWIGNNGKLYNRFWANGSGRATSIATLSKLGGAFTFLAGTAFDAQSFEDGDITPTQFGTNFGLGTIGLASSTAAIAVAPYILLNSTYPGGMTGLYLNWTVGSPNTFPENPSGSSYVSFRSGMP
jgi:RHS repeat-associated protein